MSRRTDAAAEQAAQQASEAARTLQARGQEVRAESASTEPPADSPKGEQPRVEGARPANRNEPRRQAMEEIESRHHRVTGLTTEPEPPKKEIPANLPPPTPEDMLKGSKFSESPQPAPEPEPAAEPPAPVVEMVKAKVDGEEFEVPKADVDAAGGIVAYQKDRAADNRLKKANEALAETRRVQAAMAQWMQQHQEPAKPVQTNDQFIASKMDTIRFGTPEESAAALQEVMNKTNPRIDQDAITQQAINKMQQAGATEAFKKEFQDVVSNPLLLRLAVSLETERTSKLTGPVDWNTLYRQIGNEIRSVTGKPPQPAASTAQAPTGTPSPSDKEARKASIVNLPTAGSRAALPEEAKPETREAVLNSMRKARGLPTG